VFAVVVPAGIRVGFPVEFASLELRPATLPTWIWNCFGKIK